MFGKTSISLVNSTIPHASALCVEHFHILFCSYLSEGFVSAHLDT